MKSKYISIIFLLFITGCGFDDVYYNIPENEKPVYKNGDILIYKSNTGLYDTIEINDLFVDYEISDKKYYHEYMQLSFLKYKSNKIGSIELRLNSLFLSWYGIYFKSYDMQNISRSTIYINNKKFENTYILTDFLFYPNVNHNKIIKLYYTSKYCVIKYETDTGEIWELTNY